MPSDELLTGLARTIQLAVAPVFLLTALGTLISVLTTRLGRIVDRARVLDARSYEPHQAAELHAHNDELATLLRRRYLINYAVTCATLAALQVCILIAGAFLGFMLHKNFSLFIAGMFVGAMAAFILALLLFLREILISVAPSRIRALPRA
jgi:Protein of unknown function (DUF2721)